ncbi:MAG: MarR family transcriptional regulator [Elusimicrobia bacterium]|nr:MarR family transcriptional regulator [Elusimicrobiota bacterium]
MDTLTDNRSVIEIVFGKRSRLEVLRCLYEASNEISGREIARRTGLSHQQAHQSLKELVSLGLVEYKIAAPAHLFYLNKNHWVVSEILQVVFDKEKSWLKNLLDDVTDGLPKQVVSLILFGSAAKGRLRAGSDIDLLALVGREKDKKAVLDYLVTASVKLGPKYHYPVAPLVLAVSEFREQYAQGSAFARNILKTASVVKGKMLTQIL